MRKRKKRFFNWKTIIVLIYLIGVSLFLFFNKYGYKTYLTLENKQKSLEKIKTELIQKKETLKRELELQNASSPFFIEMIARERLRMAKEGEYIYYISKTKKKSEK
ncbi:conserved hypothetical protein [Thermotomaculum hydrothermale]|uniref:Septum formation initiator n=1 Tax=Thermotomaculum hydrothermale TaxID=981385 RepID=A0A7R6PEZ9_9BACT|nr:septum formation initiator family protein [Thermotomaculum hydrothermale]BBB32493.1 conserved hypothetical protein [Thermotomaculum hydrothermale]